MCLACRQLVMCPVRQEKKPFAEGGMRFCVRMYELDDNGDFMPVTALCLLRCARHSCHVPGSATWRMCLIVSKALRVRIVTASGCGILSSV